MSGTGKKAFTLLEVLVATAVLAFGTLLVFEAFISCVDAFAYCRDYAEIAPFVDEKVREAENLLSIYGPRAKMARNGEFSIGNKSFFWNLSYGPSGGGTGLYRIDARISWKEGIRTAKIERSAYAIYREEE